MIFALKWFSRKFPVSLLVVDPFVIIRKWTKSSHERSRLTQSEEQNQHTYSEVSRIKLLVLSLLSMTNEYIYHHGRRWSGFQFLELPTGGLRDVAQVVQGPAPAPRSRPCQGSSNNHDRDHGYAQSLFDSFLELGGAGIDHQQTDNMIEDAKPMTDLKASIVKCCEAIAANATTQAYALVSELRDKSSSTGTTVERLAFYFSEALIARITGTGRLLYNTFKSRRTIDETLQIFATVAQTSPGFGLPIFFTNQTILDETSSAARVHVVDFGIGPGYRWLCLIKDFSERSGGPPHFRVTAVDRPSNSLFFPREDVGGKLERYASSLGVPFEFHSVVTAEWDSIQSSQLMIQPEEVLIVTSFHELRELSDDSKRRFLRNIHGMEPKLFLNAAFPPVGFNSPSLVARAREAFDFHAGVFEAIAASLAESRFAGERRFLEQLRGLEILNTVACEGEDRVKRPEGYKQWHQLMRGAGFQGYEIKRHVYTGAKQMLATYSNAREYSVGRSGNWILLRRNRQVLIAISNWTC